MTALRGWKFTSPKNVRILLIFIKCLDENFNLLSWKSAQTNKRKKIMKKLKKVSRLNKEEKILVWVLNFWWIMFFRSFLRGSFLNYVMWKSGKIEKNRWKIDKNRRKLEKIGGKKSDEKGKKIFSKNRGRSRKVGKNQRKTLKIGENRRNLGKIGGKLGKIKES